VQKLQAIGRRPIYVLVFLVGIIAFLWPLGLPVSVQPDTLTVYKALDALPAGSLVWFGAEYDVSTKPELDPQVVAVFHHLFQKNLKPVIYGMWLRGPTIVQGLVEPIAEEYGKQYGVDWINLGHKPGTSTNLRLMTSNITEGAAGVDHFGKPLANYPIMRNVTALDKASGFRHVVIAEAGTPGNREYLGIVVKEKAIPMSVATLTMSIAENKPFVVAGDFTGQIPGLRGAAEYEYLVGKAGKGASGTDAQSLAALLVFGLVVLGNIGYLTSPRR
jgi:hypothetical protein